MKIIYSYIIVIKDVSRYLCGAVKYSDEACEITHFKGLQCV